MSTTFAGQYGPNPAVNLLGTPLPNSEFTVNQSGTTTPAAVFTDRTQVNQASQPLMTDDIGNMKFFVAPGLYDVTCNGITETVSVYADPTDPTAFQAGSLTSASGAVSVAAATAPTAGQVLTATSPTTATWQTIGIGTSVSRSSSATLQPNEFTSFTGSTAGQTLTLPTAVATATENVVTNASSVSVTLAAGAGDTLSNNGQVGSVLIPPNQSVEVVMVGAVWVVQSFVPVAILIAVADNGATDQSATLTTQLNLWRALGYIKARLPGAISAYGVSNQLLVPWGMGMEGDGPLSFKYAKSSGMTAGNYYGTALVVTSAWAEPTNGIDATPMLAGFDIRQDTGCTVSVAQGSTVLDPHITAADAGRPVNGYGIPQFPLYVGTVTVGVSFTLVDSSGNLHAATDTGTVVNIGTGQPLGGMVTLGTQSGGTPGSTQFGAARIKGITINCTGDGVASTGSANVGVFMAGAASKMEDCITIDGKHAGLATSAGSGGETGQDGLASFCCFTNRETQYANGPLLLTGTIATKTTSGYTCLEGITNLPSYGAMLNGVIGVKGTSGTVNGAMVIGTGIPANTFVAPGGYLADGSGTLMLTNAINTQGTSGFTGTDVVIIMSDCVGLAAHVASADFRIYEPLVQYGTLKDSGTDLKVHGGNIFGASNSPINLGVAITSFTNISGPTGSPSSFVVQANGTGFPSLTAGQTITITGCLGGQFLGKFNGTFIVTGTPTSTAVQFTYWGSAFPTGTYTGSSGTLALFTPGAAPLPGQYTIITKGKGSQFVGITFGPGAGGAAAAGIRRDSGVVCVSGSFYEMDNGNWPNQPAFEDNGAWGESTGGFTIVGMATQGTGSNTGSNFGTNTPWGSIVYRRDGVSNPRSTVMASLTAGNIGSVYWSGGGNGYTQTATAGQPGLALVNLEGSSPICIGITSSGSAVLAATSQQTFAGPIDLSAGFDLGYTAVTGSTYQALNTDSVVLCAASVAQTITLPVIGTNSPYPGQVLWVLNGGSGTGANGIITITPASGQTIDTVSGSATIYNGEAACFIYDQVHAKWRWMHRTVAALGGVGRYTLGGTLTTLTSTGTTSNTLDDGSGNFTAAGQVQGTRLIATLAPTSWKIAGRGTGGPNYTGTYVANDYVFDASVPGLFYTPGGGTNPTDWVNALSTLSVNTVNGQSLKALGTGLLKNTTTTGVPSIAVAGTDYPATGVITAGGPTGSATAIPVITYNANGQLTTVSTAAVNPTQVNGVAITSGQATILSQMTGGTTRSATATLVAGEETVFTGSTAAQTLTLPGSTAQVSSVNTIVNLASVTVTLAPGSGTTLNNLGTTGNMTLAVNQLVQVVLIGTVWYVVDTNTAAGIVGTMAVGNGGTGATTLTGLVKGNGTSAFTAAVANTDYLPVASPTATGLTTLAGLKSNAGAITLPAINSNAGAARADSATITAGSATVTDASCVLGDVGKLVTATGAGSATIPANTYVGSVSAGVSFTLSSVGPAAPNFPQSVNAGGSGTNNQATLSASCTVNGDALKGQIVIVSGASALAAGTLQQLQYSALSSIPFPILSPGNSNAAGLKFYVTGSAGTTSWSLAVTAALTLNSTYIINYWMPQ